MNIKHLCLIAGLLGLPVAYANAGEITINVPVEITNFPAATGAKVTCRTGIGDGTESQSSGISRVINIPANRNYSGVVAVTISGSRVDSARSYTCNLRAWSTVSGQPVS